MAAPIDDNQNPSHIYVWDDANTQWSGWDGVVTASLSDDIPTTLANGQKTVTTAGTAEVLGASAAIQGIIIKALSTNTNNVYVGTSTVDSTNGYVLRRGASVAFDIDNVADVYLDVDTNGEGVSYLTVAS
jgi:hypothetical protein